VQQTEFNYKNEKNLLFFEIFSKCILFPQKPAVSKPNGVPNKLV